MFFKIALRNLIKRKVYAFINIFGLAVGLAACLMIYLFVDSELSYDKSYPDADRIVRIVRESGQGGEKSHDASSNYQLGKLAKENLSQIDKLTQFSMARESKVSFGDKIFNEKRIHWADNNFFQVFGTTAIEGTLENVLSEPNQLVITSEIKQKLFPGSDAVGQLLDIDGRAYEVLAVVEPMPEASHFHFDYLLSIETTKNIYSKQMFEHWGNMWLYTYAKLEKGASMSDFDALVNNMAMDHGPGEALKQFGIRFYSQKVSDIHLHSNLGSELEQNGDFQLLTILIAVALLILLIACFNFINLSTARSMWRAKEVGVKKVLGINKVNLINQFLGESLLITSISLVVSLVLISVALPIFNDFTGKHLSIVDVLLSIPALVSIVLIVGLIAGSIPAVLMSSFDPLDILKGKSSQGNTKTAGRLRQILVILQFAIAIILVVGSTVIYQQLGYIKNKDLGADINNVMVINFNNKNTKSNLEAFKNKVSQLNTVTSASVGSDLPFEKLNAWRISPASNADQEQLINVIAIDDNYLNTLDINWAEGGVEKLDENIAVVNEAFVKYFLIADPVGSQIKVDWMEEPVTIAGVSKDFHFESLHTSIRPILLYKLPNWYSKLIVRTDSENKLATVEGIKNIWKEVNSGEEFDYFFLEDKFERMYSSEEKTADMVTFFSIFSILIACLGLYGLAAFLAESKIKEISIRKVLGASMNQLINIQFRVFGKLIIVGAIVGLPLAYYLVDDWLNNFVYRIDIPLWVLPLSVALIVLFAAISVSYSSIKAALTNPSDNLRVD